MNSTVSPYIDAMPFPCVVIDRGERITHANMLAVSLLGQGLVGRHYISALRQPNLLDAVEQVLTTGEARMAAYLSVDGSRDTTWRARLAPVPDGLMLSFEDLTHMEEAGQMRRDFIANVSHELRTPLTALSGFIETLRGAARDDPAARDRFLAIMEREAARMNRLVHDLLSLSRVESEERMRPTARVELAEVLRGVINGLRPVAEEAGAAVTLDLGGQEGAMVNGDADQLAQVFSNLVENAIKYGGRQVEVTLTAHPHDPMLRGPGLRVEVADHGDGIDPVHLPRLTERFYRIDTHRSREVGGTGLGLAIVKHIVSRHRGRLRIDSKLGQGSVFAVLLPHVTGAS